MLMDIDFDDQSLDLAATNAKAGVKFKPKPKSRLRKQASVSTSQALSKEDLYDVTDQSIHGIVSEKKEENHLDKETQEFLNNFSTGTSDPDFIVNEKPKDEALNSKNITSDDLVQEELNPKETVPEMDTGQAPHGWEHEEQAKSPVAGKEGYVGDTVREKNVRKSKRVAEKKKNINKESNQSSKKPQKKKTKQSTCRKTLEKELLKTPEDEIQFLPIKDMLKLVDYREYLERKETIGESPQNQERTSKHHSQDDCRENEETSKVEPDLPVNYHTFGQRTGRSRWSKQDNELFYEGIREFGSNLEMVQQLFPNRSRQHMKLKFKLEERKHPLKLTYALTSRAKHHTHFQNVIKKLQEEAATREEGEEEEAEIAEEERTDVPQNGKPRKSDVTEKAEVKESDGREAGHDFGSDGGEAENDLRSDGRDEDEVECDYWGNYTSDI